jgi:YHS domain-containing protein
MLLRTVLELIFIFLAVRAVWRLLGGIVQGLSPQSGAPHAPKQPVSMARDPVCGTFVLPDRAVSLSDGRQRIYFCSAACRDKYRSRTA